MSNVVIEAKKVSFSYSSRNKVINSVSLKVERGKFYGLIGPNGSGKTTLLDLLMGIRKPDEGCILLFQKDLKKYERSEIAKKISLVPQFFKADLPYTVEEVVFMGRYPYMGRFPVPSKRDKEIVNRVIELLNLKDFKDRYITSLSGGERQLVIFARAIAQDTPIIFLDEATSHLDIKHTIKILRLIKEKVIKEEKTVISVFHDLNLASMFVDEVIFLKKGVLIKSGPLKETLKKEVIEKVFDIECDVKDLSTEDRYVIIPKKEF